VEDWGCEWKRVFNSDSDRSDWDMDGRCPRGRTAQRTRRAALCYWATLHPKAVVPGFGGLIVTDVGVGGGGRLP
jgi:hypothetical protein